uniref:NADH-ubiquinone oxidoreductase chain 2 n=1 Tax=Aurospio banyulensis TaxID=3050091 RepID=A0AAU6QGD4_9ANNE
MFQYPYMNLFLFTLFSSTMMAISSSHWLMVWMSLELNMISFLPLIASSSWFQESEGALKYLLFQALGSSFILLGTMTTFLYSLSLIGLLIKLGAAPFHFWFPSVMKSLAWPAASLLMTWQKIAPLLVIMSSFSFSSATLSAVGMISALTGGLGGLNQSHFRPMLAYSSIGHMGWMIALMTYSPFISSTYLFFYIFISIPVLYFSAFLNIQSIKKGKNSSSYILALCLLPTILSLSGLPPFLGFAPKIFALLAVYSIPISIILIFGSLLNLSYYLNFFFSLYMSDPAYKNLRPTLQPNPMSLGLLWCACCPVPFVFVLFLFI